MKNVRVLLQILEGFSDTLRYKEQSYNTQVQRLGQLLENYQPVLIKYELFTQRRTSRYLRKGLAYEALLNYTWCFYNKALTNPVLQRQLSHGQLCQITGHILRQGLMALEVGSTATREKAIKF